MGSSRGYLFSRTWLLAAAILCGLTMSAFSQDKKQEKKEEDRYPGVKWIRSPEKANIGGYAEVKLEDGWMATDGDGARKILKAWGNLVGDSELAMIGNSDLSWCVIFEFDDIGYVKDDEKNSLDAAKLLETKKTNAVKANEMRKEQGLPTMEILGWQKEPFYNSATHNLEWGLKIKVENGAPEVNYNVKVLGRKGVMDVTLLVDPAKMDETMPIFEKLISNFAYKQGNKYAEYVSGDKVAKYGLTALVLGGGVALAAKAGIFKYLWKIIIFGGIALAAVGKKILEFFKNLFGMGKRPGEY